MSDSGQVPLTHELSREVERLKTQGEGMRLELIRVRAEGRRMRIALLDAQTFLHAAQKNYTFDWATAVERVDAALAEPVSHDLRTREILQHAADALEPFAANRIERSSSQWIRWVDQAAAVRREIADALGL